MDSRGHVICDIIQTLILYNFLALRCFADADTDSNGKLSRNEFRNLLRNAGIDVTQRQASFLFQKADADKSGKIDFEEFKEVCLQTRFSFRSIPEPGSEFIQLSKLSSKHVMKIREFFGRFDTNRDGKLSPDEWIMMFQCPGMSDKIQRRCHSLAKRNFDMSLSFRDFMHMFSTVEELNSCIGYRPCGVGIWCRWCQPLVSTLRNWILAHRLLTFLIWYSELIYSIVWATIELFCALQEIVRTHRFGGGAGALTNTSKWIEQRIRSKGPSIKDVRR